MDSDGIWLGVVRLAFEKDLGKTYDARGYSDGIKSISVEVYDKGRKHGMQKHGQQYLHVDCPLDEAKYQWPSTSRVRHPDCTPAVVRAHLLGFRRDDSR